MAENADEVRPAEKRARTDGDEVRPACVERERERKTASQYGVVPGMHVINIAPARRPSDEGYQFIAVASKAGVILAKVREAASALDLGAGWVVVEH